MRTAENLSVSEDPGGITPIKLRDTVILRAAYDNPPRLSARRSSGTLRSSAAHTAIIRSNHRRGRPGTAADPTPASSLHKRRSHEATLSRHTSTGRQQISHAAPRTPSLGTR